VANTWCNIIGLYTTGIYKQRTRMAYQKDITIRQIKGANNHMQNKNKRNTTTESGQIIEMFLLLLFIIFIMGCCLCGLVGAIGGAGNVNSVLLLTVI
jgi:hypothetical protein